MMMLHRLLLALLLLSYAPVQAGERPSSTEIRALMLKNWSLIKDYEVSITLAIHIPGFRMPARKIHYYYKAPDKSKVEVKGFAIVPKQGLQPFFTFLKDSVNLQVTGDSLLAGKAVFKVVLADTFMQKAGRIQLLVDQHNGSIYEARVFHDGHPFFHLTTAYTLVEGLPLPQETRITMQFPPEFKNIQRLGKKPRDMKAFEAGITDEWIEGSITISFEDYALNRGLPDYLFEEAEESIQD